MTTRDRINGDQNLAKIVRLKVDGAASTVNTLRDQQTDRGVSLICPFPALELSLKADFGSAAEGGMRSGTIHRIGVEDDPETGLPRLRLSIRSEDTRSTVVKQPRPSLIEESSSKTEAITEAITEALTEAAPEAASEAAPEAAPEATPEPQFHSFNLSPEDDDPEWVNCDELPLPEEFLERSKTRRRYKMIRRAVYMTLLMVLVGAGVVVERTGIVDMDEVRSYVAGLTVSAPKAPAPDPIIETIDEPMPEEIVEVAEEPAPESAPEPAVAPEMIFEEAPEKAPDAIAAPAPEAVASPNSEVETDAAVAPAPIELVSATPPEPEVSEAAAQPEMPEMQTSEAMTNEITIVLPTKWPVEYASGYRIRDPNGVVIDVPGGLVKREGWLEVASEHGMIRSVKSIQRETGARFVIYVNGESLPRFMTSPRADGVSLRLYDLDTETITSQEVAMAD